MAITFQSIYQYILIWKYIYIVYTLTCLVYYIIYHLRLFHTMLLFMVVWESGPEAFSGFLWCKQVHTEMLICIMACLVLSGLLQGVGFRREAQ
jgi:hypothetical protein